jgi:hypothetical protein
MKNEEKGSDHILNDKMKLKHILLIVAVNEYMQVDSLDVYSFSKNVSLICRCHYCQLRVCTA